MYYQNDTRWKNMKLGNTSKTIGQIGCLLTAHCNIHEKKTGETMTPIRLNSLLLEKNGYTKDGLIIWGVLAGILNARIDHNYTGSIDYDMYNFYIVNYNNFGYGHFTNLIEKSGNDFFVFDVYDNLNKIKHSNDIRRVVKVYYN